jgi:hypothetical protein
MDALPKNRLRCVDCKCFRPIGAFPFQESLSGLRGSTCISCVQRQAKRRAEDELHLQEQLRLQEQEAKQEAEYWEEEEYSEIEREEDNGTREYEDIPQQEPREQGTEWRHMDVNERQEYVERRSQERKATKQATRTQKLKDRARRKAQALATHKQLQEQELRKRVCSKLQGQTLICTRCFCSRDLSYFGKFKTCSLCRVSSNF